MEKEFEDAARFVIGSGNITAFDRGLATVSLRTEANTPGRSFPVFLTASFGSQLIMLKAGETEFRVVFEIHEAEAIMTTIGLDLDFGKEFHVRNEVASAPIPTEVTERSHSQNEASLQPTNGKFQKSRMKERSVGRQSKELSGEFEHVQVKHLKIGKRTKEHPLEGVPVADYQGWTATRTDFDNPSGVKVELNVRDSWVKFRDPYTESKTKTALLFNKLTSGSEREVSNKREMFTELLKVLALKGLRSSSAFDGATLDVDAIVCVPSGDTARSYPDEIGPGYIPNIDEQILIDFLRAGETEAALILERVKGSNQASSAPRVFVPHCSVASAFKCWETILEAKADSPIRTHDAAVDEFGRNEVQDLRSAGLLSRSNDTLAAINHFPELSNDKSFKAFICRKPSIRFVMDLLLDDPEIEGPAIGELVATRFDKSWNPSSCRSNGQRLRAWTGFAASELLVTSPKDRLARYLNWQDGGGKRRGPPSIWVGESLEKIRRLKKSGLSRREIADQMGVQEQSFNNHIHNNRKVWDDL